MSYEAGLLRSVGRIGDALPLQQQGARLRPTTPSLAQPLIDGLAAAGRVAEAQAAAARAQHLWPDRLPPRRATLDLALLYLTPDQAEAALDTFQSREPRLEPGLERAWRAFVADRRSGRLRPETARALTTESPPVWWDSVAVVVALSELGDVDDALAFANSMAEANPSRLRIGLMFGPGGRPMLRDPRFMALAARIGLVTYWKTTGHWPDFCAWPDLPYDCKAEAAKYR